MNRPFPWPRIPACGQVLPLHTCRAQAYLLDAPIRLLELERATRLRSESLFLPTLCAECCYTRGLARPSMERKMGKVRCPRRSISCVRSRQGRHDVHETSPAQATPSLLGDGLIGSLSSYRPARLDRDRRTNEQNLPQVYRGELS